MRLYEKVLLRYTSMCIAVLTFGLIGLVLSSTMDPAFKIWGIVLTLSIAGASVMFFTLLSLQVRSELQALSETLQDLGNGVPITVVTEADTLLAKVHHQVVRLAGILESHAKRHREEKESINALISDISHQLKTPLANLKMYYQLLLDSNLSAQERAGFTEHMQSQIEKLSWLLDSLLKMSRLETGIINQNPRRASIAQTVLQAIEMVSLAAEQKSIDVSFRGDQSIELCHDSKWTQEAVFIS